MRGASRVGGDRAQDAHGVLPFRASLLRDALRLPCGVWPRVRDVRLPCDDALPPAETLLFLRPVAGKMQPDQTCSNSTIFTLNCDGRSTGEQKADPACLSLGHCYVHSYFGVFALFLRRFTQTVGIEVVSSHSCGNGIFSATLAGGGGPGLPR
jgi:hypothetical protein